MTEKIKSQLAGQTYRHISTLYSKDGKRSAAILEFESGETYLDEQEWMEGTTFKNRHSGNLVGPFASPSDAESFIVRTPWFRGARIMYGPAWAIRHPLALTVIIALTFTLGLTVVSWLN